MSVNIVAIIAIIFMLVIMGFVIDVHSSQCSMPDLQLPNDTFCPAICECTDRDVLKCQVPACDHLDCINWYWMCIYKWR